MRYTHTEKPNIALRLAALLLCLTLFSLYLLSGLYARYTVTGTAADSARVAAFQPTATITPATGTVNYVYGQSTSYNVTYDITVTNPSEVAVDCELVITKDAFLSSKEGAIWFWINNPDDPSNPLSIHPILIGGTDYDWSVLETVSLGTLDAHDTVGVTRQITVGISSYLFNLLIADSNFETGKLDLTQYFTASVTFTQVD